MTEERVEMIRKWREEDPDNRGVIAATRSFELAPWADIIHARDHRFWKNYYSSIVEISDAYLTTYHSASDISENIHKVDIDRMKEGGNSGYQSIMIAILYGAERVFILGIDMQHTKNKTHWHEGYPTGLGNSLEKLGTMGSVFKRWIHHFDKLNKEKVKIINCSMRSQLTCFPKKPIEECI